MKKSPNQLLTALVVDDSRAIRELLAAMLEAEGVGMVLQAQDGVSAFRELERASDRIDLLFCDLAMPGVDGVETLRGLAARHLDVGVVLLSGLDRKLMATVADMAQQLGLLVLGALHKPFRQDDVRSLLDDYRRSAGDRPKHGGLSITPQELEDAIRHDRIEVYYQPKIRLADGALVGVEALARLQHPAYGIIEPDAFISVAEHCGQITPLTMTVLHKALAQTGEWAKAGLSLGISVNLSALAVSRLDLPEIIARAADEAHVPHDRITLELTESQLAGGAELLHIMSRFRLQGFKLAIDDYGTGHSGLRQLRNLPFTELKIDQAFVRNASRDRDLQSILETSIDLGRRLRMEVVAEGVETWPDWHLLKALGCDVAQGFIAARPIAGPGIPLWAQRWSAGTH